MVQGRELVDLVATQEPSTTAIEDTVVVTVPVTFAGDPQQRGGTLRLHLTIHQADYLRAQTTAALVTANVNRQRKK